MSNSERVMAALLLGIGYVVMFLFGRAYQKIISAHNAHKKAQALVPSMRTAFWAAVRAAFGLVFLAGFVMLMLGVFALTGNSTATPQPSPSPSPSRPR